jgi:hypothetical protein
MEVKMNLKFRLCILSFVDLMVSIGAVYLGSGMLRAGQESLGEYPHQWLAALPFQNWYIPGILVILIFGIGNMAASLLCFLKNNGFSWYMSAAMGGVMYLTMIWRVLTIGDWHLITVACFAFSIFQLFLCRSVYLEQKRRASGDTRSHSYINTGYF